MRVRQGEKSVQVMKRTIIRSTITRYTNVAEDLKFSTNFDIFYNRLHLAEASLGYYKWFVD